MRPVLRLALLAAVLAGPARAQTPAAAPADDPRDARRLELRGLEDTLGLRSGESLMIFGASGGVGDMAGSLALMERTPTR